MCRIASSRRQEGVATRMKAPLVSSSHRNVIRNQDSNAVRIVASGGAFQVSPSLRGNQTKGRPTRTVLRTANAEKAISEKRGGKRGQKCDGKSEHWVMIHSISTIREGIRYGAPSVSRGQPRKPLMAHIERPESLRSRRSQLLWLDRSSHPHRQTAGAEFPRW